MIQHRCRRGSHEPQKSLTRPTNQHQQDSHSQIAIRHAPSTIQRSRFAIPGLGRHSPAEDTACYAGMKSRRPFTFPQIGKLQLGKTLHYFCFTRSARFKSRSDWAITRVSGEFFFSGSIKAEALPTTTRLEGPTRYFSVNAVTSFGVIELIDGINLSSVSNGRLKTARTAT